MLAIILIFGFLLRVTGLNWDQGFHLHPDERFLTMVGIALKLPSSLMEYLNPTISSINPANVGFPFFVYGLFPLTLNKVLAVFFKNDTYEAFNLQGRALSAFIDVIAIFTVYKIVQLLEKRYALDSRTKLLAAFFYSIAVLPIQLSHFFAVDTFLNAFLLLSIFWILKNRLVFAAMAFGLALSSKITAVFVLPIIVLLAIQKHKTMRTYLVEGLIFVFITYVIVRLANPYMFADSNIFNPAPNNLFIQNLKQLKALDNPEAWFPPAVQWIHKQPVIYALVNLAVFGVGVPYFALIILGTVHIFRQRKKYPELLSILVWVLAFFLYQSTQFVKTLRYFIILYPYMAIFAAVGFSYFLSRAAKFMRYAVLVAVLIWPIAFLHIYFQPHSRVAASEWIHRNIPTQSVLLSEHWDDALPLPMVWSNRQYSIKELPVFAQDTPEKWQEMNALLQEGDYYILSSNRAWGSISTVPERYPLMSRFYEDLFKNKTNYKFIKKFSSYPSLRYLGIPIDFPDNKSEELFTVYDHPEVYIFKKY